MSTKRREKTFAFPRRLSVFFCCFSILSRTLFPSFPHCFLCGKSFLKHNIQNNLIGIAHALDRHTPHRAYRSVNIRLKNTRKLYCFRSYILLRKVIFTHRVSYDKYNNQPEPCSIIFPTVCSRQPFCVWKTTARRKRTATQPADTKTYC